VHIKLSFYYVITFCSLFLINQQSYYYGKNKNRVNMTLLVDCTNSLLLVLNYTAVNIYVNTFLKQRKNCEYFLLTEGDVEFP
jgi:hypothetical protein